MEFKKLLNKDKVYESWLNPILNGDTNNILPPGSFNPYSNENESPGITLDNCVDMIEKPNWLLSDTEDASIVKHGDVLSIGSYFINGVPLSAWSSNFGSSLAFNKKRMMMNWQYIDALSAQLFPNGIAAYINKTNDIEININKLTILKLIPHSNAIGLNIYIKFMLNDIEIFGKFENVGIDITPKFICEEIKDFNKENTIKITGRLWNILLNWFKIKPGIYTCIAKDILIYNELGQLKKISSGNIIEVISSSEDKIKIRFNDINYIIKKPIYYWFNWYFKK